MILGSPPKLMYWTSTLTSESRSDGEVEHGAPQRNGLLHSVWGGFPPGGSVDNESSPPLRRESRQGEVETGDGATPVAKVSVDALEVAETVEVGRRHVPGTAPEVGEERQAGVQASDLKHEAGVGETGEDCRVRGALHALQLPDRLLGGAKEGRDGRVGGWVEGGGVETWGGGSWPPSLDF